MANINFNNIKNINDDLFFHLREIKEFDEALNRIPEGSEIDEEINHKDLLKNDNSFLGVNDKVKFYIFDLPQLITCPGRTPICEKGCYQIPVEKMHKDTNGRRDSQIVLLRKCHLYLSLKDDFASKMYKKIIRLRPRQKTVIIRLHASGDFYSTEYILKWLTISRAVYLSQTKGKKPKNHPYLFVAYTKSFVELDTVLSNQSMLKKAWDDANKLFYGDNIPKADEATSTLSLPDFVNIKIIGSIMDDTTQHGIDIIKKYDLSTYTVIDTKQHQVPAGTNLTDCKTNSCADCLKCYATCKTNITTALR